MKFKALTNTHKILSATHADTLPAGVVAGDIIIGNSTPAWARLAKGANNQVLTSKVIGASPAWVTLSFSGIGGTASVAQIPHGHTSQSGTPLASPSADQDFTTNVFANWTGMTISLTARNAGQGLKGYIYVNVIFKFSAVALQGEIAITEDLTTQAYTIPISENDTLWHTTLFFYPINVGAGFLDALTHTYQIQARLASGVGTLTLAGTTYVSFLSGVDLGQALPVA